MSFPSEDPVHSCHGPHWEEGPWTADSCSLEVGDTGQETAPKPVLRSIRLSFLFCRLLSHTRPGPPETGLATLDSWLLKKRAWLT